MFIRDVACVTGSQYLFYILARHVGTNINARMKTLFSSLFFLLYSLNDGLINAETSLLFSCALFPSAAVALPMQQGIRNCGGEAAAAQTPRGPPACSY